ncbi:hypothetical protein [Clostridium sp. JN-9]|nr:hypothetical protein [Clostridium sp. JN-9]
MKVVKEDKERKKARRASKRRIKGQITFFDDENGGEMSNDYNGNKVEGE